MRPTVRVAVGVAALLAVGCFRSPPTHFYSLSPAPTEIQREVSVTGPHVELLIAAFPSYLNNPQMALRRADGEIVVDEFNRWIEELKTNFERTVMENLVTRLNNASVVVVQPYQVSESGLSLRVEVVQFDVSEQGEAVLKARWGVFDEKRTAHTRLTLSVFREHVDSNSVEARVSALSRTVAALSVQLARAVRGTEG